MTDFYWVIGTPRSGTTMLTDFIGNYTEKKFNEPFATHPVRQVAKWQLPACQSLVFKYCCNWMDATIISTRFQHSKFIHILRNPSDVVYSLVNPKQTSYPHRDFSDLGHNVTERFKNAINYWKLFVEGCFKVGENFPQDYLLVKYETLPQEIQNLATFTGLPLEESKLTYKCKNIDEKLLMQLEPRWKEFPKAMELRDKILAQHYATSTLPSSNTF